MLIIVSGGVSLGACGSLSEKGLTSFGSLTLNSVLHQETCYRDVRMSEDIVVVHGKLTMSDDTFSGFSTRSQQGPMIFRFIINNSKALVCAPKTCAMFSEVRPTGNAGSIEDILKGVRLR